MSMAAPDPRAFLGKGWAFPVQIDAVSGDIAMTAYQEDIRQAIYLILRTALGERVMRPDFGAGLETLVFEPVNTTTIALVQYRVQQALITWEPRINVNDVEVTTDALLHDTLKIKIGYTVRTTNTFYNLVYPFYLQEGQP
jgi:phage baseplate assembly protein W